MGKFVGCAEVSRPCMCVPMIKHPPEAQPDTRSSQTGAVSGGEPVVRALQRAWILALDVLVKDAAAELWACVDVAGARDVYFAESLESAI